MTPKLGAAIRNNLFTAIRRRQLDGSIRPYTNSKKRGIRSRAMVLGLIMTVSYSLVVTAGDDMRKAEPIDPLPTNVHLAPNVDLGRRLFNDSRLSSGNGVSCATCHISDHSLTDGLPVSRGLPGHPGLVNTPTLFNVGLSAKFNWSGKYLSLEEQTDKVIESPRTMGGNWNEIIATLETDTQLAPLFKQLYVDGVTRKNAIDAIVQFEKSLVTPDAPFDDYLRGNQGAISADATAGYELFKIYGCASCHQGVNVGGNMLQVFGIFGTPDAAAMGGDTPGSAEATGITEEKPVFRVPSLRNIASTGPYFHDGSEKTLKGAINTMADYQLGRDLTEGDLGKLEAFLKSLTGKYQGVPVGEQ